MAQSFEFRLNIVGPQGSWTYTIPVREEPVILGRQAGNDVVLEHQQVSRRHAALHCTENECVLVDLGSANGTRLNGQKLTPRASTTIKHGDSIQISIFKLQFEQVPLEAEIQTRQQPIKELEQPEDVLPSRVNADVLHPPMDHPAFTTLSFDPSQPPPGFTRQSERLLSYLPPIYHTEFMAGFLAIFESILFPIEWQIDGFDLFLNPGTAPASFLPWLASWFNVTFDDTWDEGKRRSFLKEAHLIYSRLGTRWALSRLLEIYCSQTIEIEDDAEDLPVYTFRVKLPRSVVVDQKHIERLIDSYKPTHTAYVIEQVG